MLQLGGDDPAQLAAAVRHAAPYGYSEVNLNCGCPAQTKGRSKNCFGARYGVCGLWNPTCQETAEHSAGMSIRAVAVQCSAFELKKSVHSAKS